jgi:hypothetical protein
MGLKYFNFANSKFSSTGTKMSDFSINKLYWIKDP